MAPVIRGNSLYEGVTLSAGYISSDPDGNGTITGYQWYLNGSAITGATSSSYLTSPAGFGIYKVAVRYNDGQSYDATVESADQVVGKIDNGIGSTGPITSSNPGIFEEGVTLSAGSISGDPDLAARHISAVRFT